MAPKVFGKGNMGKMGEKPKDFKGGIKQMLKFASPYKVGIIFSVIISCIGSILISIYPIFLTTLVNNINKYYIIHSVNEE
jgi:hypothetical protein